MDVTWPSALVSRAARRVARVVKRQPPESSRSSVEKCQECPDSGALVMGPHSYGQPRLRRYLGDTATVRVGSFVSIADNVEFIPGGNHRVDWVSTYPFRWMFQLPGALTDGHPHSKGNIVVGNDVWIATGARILSGVTIGDGAVIAAGAIVTKDVRPYSVVAGSPATEVCRRFSEDQIDALERVRWWDWPIDVIVDHVGLLCSADIDAFLAVAKRIAEQ